MLHRSLVSNVRDDRDHQVIKRVAHIRVTSVEEGRARGKRGKGPLLVLLRLLAHGPVRVVADLGRSVQEGQVGDVVAWLVDQDLVPANKLLLTLIILRVLRKQAPVIIVANALAPHIRSIFKVMHGPITLPVVSHALPGAYLCLVHLCIAVRVEAVHEF